MCIPLQTARGHLPALLWQRVELRLAQRCGHLLAEMICRLLEHALHIEIIN